MQNELQAAYEVSQLTTDRQPDAEKIAALIGAGRFVVVGRYPMYCRYTDAFIGMGTSYNSDHADRWAADGVCEILVEGLECGDYDYEVLPKLPPTLAATQILDIDDCPF